MRFRELVETPIDETERKGPATIGFYGSGPTPYDLVKRRLNSDPSSVRVAD